MQVSYGIGELGEFFEVMRQLLPILISIFVVQTTLMVVAIVSIVKKPNPWNEKILWLLISIFVNLIGPVIYFAVGSGMLDKKYAEWQDMMEQRRGQDSQYGSGGMQ